MAFYLWTSSDGYDEYLSGFDFVDTIVGNYPPYDLSPVCVSRVSASQYPVGAQATSDKLRLSGNKAYDELTNTSLTDANATWWESVLYALTSPLTIAFVWNITDNLSVQQIGYLNRIITACKNNANVKIAVEGFHFGIYGSSIRNAELAFKQALNNNGFPLSRAILLLCLSDRPDKASLYAWNVGLAYSSRQPNSYAAYIADRDSVKEWWAAGCRDIGAWGAAYATQASRSLVSKAIIRGLELNGVNLL